MENTVVYVPSLYGDHQVIAIRQALAALPGVQSIYASSAFKLVAVTYDASRLAPARVEESLAALGHCVEAESGPETIIREPDPKWQQLGPRVTQTNRLDIELSGEFRGY